MADLKNLQHQADDIGQRLSTVKVEISKQFIGQSDVVDLALSAVLAGGHSLLVGVPGLGKSLLVETMSTVLGLSSQRVQFTPDLMPSDILGSEVLDVSHDGQRHFKFIEGPIFNQLFMADEINRASPRTQSALLQAMQERSVSIAGQTRDLPMPFHVMATQNPIEQEGTYPLPEAQLDRFLFQIDLSYPDRVTERDIVLSTTSSQATDAAAVFDPASLQETQSFVRGMPIGENLLDLSLDLVRSLRPDEDGVSDAVKDGLLWGPGPRAGQALVLGAKAYALLSGDYAPNVDHLRTIMGPALAHRMSLTFSAKSQGISAQTLIEQEFETVLSKGLSA
jgi:MoxR-like ATPase